MAGHEPIVLDLLKDVGLITEDDIETAKIEAANARQSILDNLVFSGRLTQLDVTLDPWHPALFALLPQDPGGDDPIQSVIDLIGK